MAAVVSVSDIRTTFSLIVTWTAIPEEYTEGKLQGYHIIYKPIKLADRKVDVAASLTVTASATGRLEVTFTSLSAFTLYSITITGFTAQGDGIASEAVLGETCVCPPTLYTNWTLYPPYVTLSGQQPGGIIGELIMDMILSSCGTCQGGHGETVLDITRNGKGAPAKKASMGGVRADVDDKTHLSFPIIGNMEDEKYLKNFVFIPVVQSPGIAFITLANKVEEIGIVYSAVEKCWPVLVLSLIIAFIAAVLIWLSEREEKKDSKFPRSFLRGSGELTWFSLMTMTTVGFGEKVPLKVVSRLITVVFIIVGLVLLSIFVATLTVYFTVVVGEETGMIYGAKVTALRDSPGHRLGILRNAKVDPTETLIEAFDALEKGKTEGLLLDAYVAGSRLRDVYRVNKVIDTSKGLGVVLSGDAVVLQYRVRDFVKKNAKLITMIIQNSTSPLKQPDQSVATEKAQTLVNYASSTFRSAIAVTASALVVSFLIGGSWDLVRKRRERGARGYSIPPGKSQSLEMEEFVHNFYIRFSQTYHRLKMKHIKQIQRYHAVHGSRSKAKI